MIKNMEAEKRKKRSNGVIERIIVIKAYYMHVWKCHDGTHYFTYLMNIHEEQTHAEI